MRVPSAFELIWRESNGSVVNACQWHAEPTLTEPAGENSTPRRALAAISTIVEPVEPNGLARVPKEEKRAFSWTIYKNLSR